MAQFPPWQSIPTNLTLEQFEEFVLPHLHTGSRGPQPKLSLHVIFNYILKFLYLWHGDGDGAIRKLELLITNLTDLNKRSKLKGLYEYLKRNQSYLVNYEARKQANKPYSTQVAESHVECVINARHKKSGKMQWTREGAHHVLQIRATLTSKEWTTKWQGVVLSALLAAA